MQLFETQKLQSVTSNQSVFYKNLKKSKIVKIEKLCHLHKIIYKLKKNI